MRNRLVPVLVLTSLYTVTGCSSNADAQTNCTQVSDVRAPVTHKKQAGSQTDIFDQTIKVINSTDSYNAFWLSVPTITDIPTYDEDSETLIAILSPDASCGFAPVIERVEESDVIHITVGRSEFPSPEACNPVPYPTYGYNLVTIPKTYKPINVNFTL